MTAIIMSEKREILKTEGSRRCRFIVSMCVFVCEMGVIVCCCVQLFLKVSTIANYNCCIQSFVNTLAYYV